MRNRIQYIKLNNFKSFVGQVTVGPLEDFTVFVGSNVVGKHDLMDAVDFVFGTYDPDNAEPDGATRSPERQLEHTSVSVVIVRSNGVNNNITLERRLLPNDSATMSEYAVNGRVVELADYQQKLRQLHVRPHGVPVVLEASTLLQLFGATAIQRLAQFEQFCGSDEFGNVCRISTARLDAAEQTRLQQHRQLAAIIHKKKAARRRTEAYTKMKLKMKNLRIMNFHLDLWFLVQNMSGTAHDLNTARNKLAKVEESIDKQRRDHSECRRNSDIAKTRLSSFGETAPPAVDDQNSLPNASRKLTVQQQSWQQARHIAEFIAEQSGLIERLNQPAVHNLNASIAEYHRLQTEEIVYNLDMFRTLTQTIAQPHQLTPGQQTTTRQLRSEFNAKLLQRTTEFNERSEHVSSPTTDARSQCSQQFLGDCYKLLSLCDAQRERILTKLLQRNNALHHVFDVLNKVLASTGQKHVQSSVDAVSVALHELVPTVLCDSAEVADDCNRVLRTEAADASTVAEQGICTLLVLNNDDATPIDGLPPGVANFRSVYDVIRDAPDTGAIVGLDRYVAGFVRAVLCSSQRQAHAIASEHAVNAVSEDGVMFRARGDVCWLAEECGPELVHVDDQNGRAHGNISNVLTELNADGCAFDVISICNGLPDELDEEQPMVNIVERMSQTFRRASTIEWGRSASDEDRMLVLTRLHTLREMHENDVQSLTLQLDTLKRESMIRSQVDAIDCMTKQQGHIETTMEQLIDSRTNTTELVEQCQAKHASLRTDMHTLLLRLKKKNVPIALQYGSLQDIDADDPNTQDAIQVDFGSLAHLIADNDAAATARNRDDLHQLLQATAAAIELRPNDQIIAEKLSRLSAEHTAMERVLRTTDQRLVRLREVQADGLQRRLDRLRPFYQHMQRSLAEMYALTYQSHEARVYLLPEDDNADGQHIRHALSVGILLDFLPPNRRFRPKATWPIVEQFLAALATMFTVYAYTKQPFVFVPQLDRLLSGGTDALMQLVADFMVNQSERMQIIMCSDKPELFQRSDAVIGILSMDNGESLPVLFNDDINGE